MTDGNTTTLECPHCSNRVDVPVEQSGETTSCPSCNEAFRVPESESGEQPSTDVIDRVVEVAKYQKYFLWLILISMFAQVGARIIHPMLQIGFLIVLPIQLYFVYKLSTSMGYGTAVSVLLMLGQFIPCVNLIILVYLVRSATNMISELGIHVGLMGADLDEVRKTAQQKKAENVSRLFE